MVRVQVTARSRGAAWSRGGGGPVAARYLRELAWQGGATRVKGATRYTPIIFNLYSTPCLSWKLRCVCFRVSVRILHPFNWFNKPSICSYVLKKKIKKMAFVQSQYKFCGKMKTFTPSWNSVFCELIISFTSSVEKGVRGELAIHFNNLKNIISYLYLSEYSLNVFSQPFVNHTGILNKL